MKYVSYEAASETLKLFFKDNPEADEVTLDDIYTAAARDLSKPEQNKAWLGNKLTHLKHYNLVSSVYGGPRKMLKKVSLTREGVKALGRESASTAPEARTHVSLETIANDIKLFEEQNPSIILDLTVIVRKNQPK